MPGCTRAKKSMCIYMYDRRVCGVAQDLHRGYILVLLVGTFFLHV